MRKMLILLALAVVAASTSGCSRTCRNLFRRGSPCGGTAIAAPAMLGSAIPLGNPVRVQPAPQIVPQIVQPTIIAQPHCGCQQGAPVCCEPCPTQCVPCEQPCQTCDPCNNCGEIGGDSGYIGGDCGCQTMPGEYFGGFVEGSDPPPPGSGLVVPQGSGTLPGPTN